MYMLYMFPGSVTAIPPVACPDLLRSPTCLPRSDLQVDEKWFTYGAGRNDKFPNPRAPTF